MSARPRRPQALNRRPSSAIYLPDLPAYEFLPDLPDVDTPRTPDSVSSRHSGLPSPPATSAGSGSARDDATTAGSVRLDSVSPPETPSKDAVGTRSADMARTVDFEGMYAAAGARSAEAYPDDDDDDGPVNEDDNTAKFALARKRPTPVENKDPIARLKDLNQRSHDVSTAYIRPRGEIFRLSFPR
jgi:hypothetical protein